MNTEQEIRELKEKVELLENMVADFRYSDRYIFQKHIQMLNANDISFGSDKGTRIGTHISQKLAFYNATPIAQRANSSQATVSGTADATYSANEVTLINDIVTLVNELRAASVALGLIKGSS